MATDPQQKLTRFQAWLNGQPEKYVAVVTHFRVIRALLGVSACALGQPLGCGWDLTSGPGGGRLHPS